MTAAGGARVLPFVRPVDVDVEEVVEDLVSVPAAEEEEGSPSPVASSPLPPVVSPALLGSVDLVLPLQLVPMVAVVSGLVVPPVAALLAWAVSGSPVAMVASGCTAAAAVATVEVAGPRIAQAVRAVAAVAAVAWVGRWAG